MCVRDVNVGTGVAEPGVENNVVLNNVVRAETVDVVLDGVVIRSGIAGGVVDGITDIVLLDNVGVDGSIKDGSVLDNV
jgi:hypothetical protein